MYSGQSRLCMYHFLRLINGVSLSGSTTEYRPEMGLRSNLKICFKNKVTQLTQVQNSP